MIISGITNGINIVSNSQMRNVLNAPALNFSQKLKPKYQDISPYCKNSANRLCGVSFTAAHFIKKSLSKDIFEQKCVSLSDKAVQEYFSRFPKYKINEYKKLSADELQALRIISKDTNLVKITDESINMALLLKSYLDNKYGEGKYTFVSVGRSPAAIARVFEFMGQEVKYIPISGLRVMSEYKECRSVETGAEYYAKFLKQQGITKKDISNSDKKYLFFDYTYTGNSLNLFKEILLNDFGLKNCENIEFLSLNKELENASQENKSYTPYERISDSYRIKMLEELEDKYPKLQRKIASLYKSNLTDYDRLKIDVFLYNSINLFGSVPENYSGMPSLYLDNMKKIKKADKTVSVSANQYNFLLIDKLIKIGLLNYNKCNKNCL